MEADISKSYWFLFLSSLLYIFLNSTPDIAIFEYKKERQVYTKKKDRLLRLVLVGTGFRVNRYSN